MLRKIGIGCGGLLGVLLILIIVVAIISPSRDNNSSNQSSSSSSSSQPSSSSSSKSGQSKSSPVGINETAKAGDVQWVVQNAYQTGQLDSQFGAPPKQGNFVVVDFNFQNNSNKAVTLDRTSLSLMDSSSRTHSPDTDTFGYVPQDKDIFINQINPGVSKDGEVVFSVPADASGFTLDAGDANMLTNNDAYIDLGF